MGKSILDVKKVIEAMEINLVEMEELHMKNINSFRKLIEEDEKLHQSYSEELEKLDFNAREEVDNIFEYHENKRQKLEAEIREVELQGREMDLEKPEEGNNIFEYERRKHSKKIDQIAIRISYFERKSEVHKRATESMRKLAVDLKEKRENLDRRTLELAKQLEAVEPKVEQLEATLDVMKLIEDDRDVKTLRKMDDLHTSIRESEIQYEYVEVLNQTLMVKERKSNDELQEARKALVDAFSLLPNDSDIGVKCLGELEFKPFLETVERKYNCGDEEAFDMAIEIHSLWGEYLGDPHWEPLKVVNVDGQHKTIIDEGDEKLKNLKKDYGEDVYNAVTTALTEITEYSPIRRKVIVEVWNYKEDREATFGEGAAHLLKQWNDGIEEDF